MKLIFTNAMPEQGLGIPYGPREGYGAGHPNIGFIDLCHEPERIDDIPELIEFPEFKELVRFINSSDRSALTTLRCDSGFNFFPRQGFDNTVFTFLTVMLRRFHQTQDRQVFEIMYQYFERRLQDEPASSRFSEIQFRISPLTAAISETEDREGICLDFFVEAFAFSKIAARREWTKAFAIFDRYLREFNEELVSGKFNDELRD